MLAETFLNKRYQAGKDVGHTQGHTQGHKEGRIEGLMEGRTEARSEILKFLEEHPDATAAELREFLLKDYSPNRRSGGVQ